MLGGAIARVSSLVDEGHERAVRVLLSVHGTRDQWHAWADIVPSVATDGVTTWEQISGGAPALVQSPYGPLSEQTSEAFIAVLTRDGERECDFIRWAGYTEDDIPPREDMVVPAWALPFVRRLPADPKKSIQQDVPLDIVVIREPLSWLACKFPLHTQQCPTLTLPHDRSFVTACPIYHDSAYIGCTRKLGDLLLVADFDSYPISLDSVVRGTIDWQPQTQAAPRGVEKDRPPNGITYPRR